VCWTTKREIADWFAGRWASAGSPRVWKGQVRLAKASEYEIVTIPTRSRPIKWRRSSLSGNCPEMNWAKSGVALGD